tara:strand:+ start:377 stop:649 length:273 start_codon:yes stop_codon:yes gene_type:complete
MSKEIIQEVIVELEGIIWEAEKADYFSIDDLRPLIRRLKSVKWPENPTVAQKIKQYKAKDWLMLILAWFLVPIIILCLPFAYIYSMIFQS